MSVRARARLLLLAATVALAGGGAAAATGAGKTRLVIADHVFGRRYCELLLVRHRGRAFSADVFNTYGLNNCPSRAWAAIDTAAVARATGALVAVRNGPRYWAMSEIEKYRTGPEIVRNLGGLPMTEEATLALANLSTAPFTVHRVDRTTIFVYRAGQTVFELHAPGGATYVMQSWSQQIDPRLGFASLPHLGPRLTLPHGWSYRARHLHSELRVATVNLAAQVLQDNLDDTYSREAPHTR